ncbi:MAG: ABC-F family ATP-binding cassette domain-containing protein [Phycisphaerae bacterium]
MAVAELKDITKAYSGRSILRGITLDLQPGQRVGLVGPNGAGKTTLVKILAGVEEADAGEVQVSRQATLSYVSQQPRLDPESTLQQQVSLVFAELHAVQHKMEQAAAAMAEHPSGPLHDQAIADYDHLQHHFEHMGGWDIERRLDVVMQQLGFKESDYLLPIKALSGGQKSRAQLAQMLLMGPDLLLLDEPTNHLDLPMLDWLEQALCEMSDAAMLIVSHDRYFLDSVATDIIEMSEGRIEHYPGNYSDYLVLRAERMLARQRQFDQQQTFIAKQEEYIRRFQAGQRARQARGRKTRLNRLKETALAAEPRGKKADIILNLAISRHSGHEVLKVQDLAKSFGSKDLFRGLELNVIRGSRIGIVGPNGSGKSTLLNILAGKLQPDAGTVHWGHAVALQFYQQEHQDLDLKKNIFQELRAARPTASEQDLRDLAALFQFRGDDIEKPVGVLSGGEKARVAMAKLLLKPTNTILMDEPTNHLDMDTCRVVEAALDSYDGTLILVSHDRYFLDSVCDQLLVLEPGDQGPTWRLFDGSYSEYLDFKHAEKTKASAQERQRRENDNSARQRGGSAPSAAKTNSAAKPTARKLPLHLQKLTLDQLEKLVHDLEDELKLREESFADAAIASDLKRVAEVTRQCDELRKKIGETMAAWEAKAAESAR